jgi:hypothetical protein
VTKHKSFLKDTLAPVGVPASESDDNLLECWKNNLSSVWHMMGTGKMGRPGDAKAKLQTNQIN